MTDDPMWHDARALCNPTFQEKSTRVKIKNNNKKKENNEIKNR